MGTPVKEHLLLGLKGTLSEAELHFLKQRMISTNSRNHNKREQIHEK